MVKRGHLALSASIILHSVCVHHTHIPSSHARKLHSCYERSTSYKLCNIPFFNPVFGTFYFLVIDELIVSVLRPLHSPPVTLGIQHNIKMLLALLNINYHLQDRDSNLAKRQYHILTLWIICKIQHFTFKHQNVL